MIWTAKQKEAFLNWAKSVSEKYGIVFAEDFIDKAELTDDDIAMLRQVPSFADVESQIVPQDKSALAKKLAQSYKSISDIPEEYLKSFKEDGVTDDDLEKAFKEKAAEEKYSNMTTEQEQRKKDLEEASSWSNLAKLGQEALDFKTTRKDEPVLPGMLAMAMKLMPKEADRHFVQYGLKDNGAITSNPGLITSALLGAMANGLELLPFPLLGTFGAPALRLAESAKSELPYSLADAGKDAAFNALSYGPLTKLGELAKSALGSIVGPALEKTSLPRAMSNIAQSIDNASFGDKVLKNRMKEQEKYLNEFNEIPTMDKIQVEKTARRMENAGFPGLANAAREYNVTTQGGVPITLTEEAKSNLLYPSRYTLSADKKKLLYNSENAKNFGKEVKMPNIHSAGTKKNRQAAIDKAVSLSPSKATKLAASALDNVARPAIRIKTNPNNVTTNMERQWEAGFVPREGTDLYEQYKVWRDVKKGDK